MRASGIDVSMMDLGRLLDTLEQGKLGLPEFQRDFDWSAHDVKELLVTVFSGWPAGSLLLLRGRPSYFRLRSFLDTSLDTSSLEFVVLDGQQRLTSLYHALRDKGPVVFAIDVDLLSNERDIDGAILTLSREEWSTSYSSNKALAHAKLIPCSSLRSASDFFEWRDEVCSESNDQAKLSAQLTSAYKNFLSTLHSYEFPAVILEESVEPAAIARIFERVNRLGMRLGTFDLMVARVFEKNWNLRDEWDRIKREFPEIEAFLGDDGMPLLQTISLEECRDVRQRAVLNLEPSSVHHNWDRAAQGIHNALNFLQSFCGVYEHDLIPYKNILVLYGSLDSEFPLEDNADFFQKLFWSKGFSQAYDSSAHTRLVSDFEKIREHFRIEQDFAFPSVDSERLRFAARQSHRSIWASFLCLLTVNDNKGLLSELYGRNDSPSQRLRVCSLIPRGIEPELPELSAPHLRCLGMVQASPQVSQRIARGELGSVLGEAVDSLGTEAVDRALSRHFLPDHKLLLELVGKWQELIDWRLNCLSEHLTDELGLKLTD